MIEVGPTTILRGSGTGSVVTFDGGEPHSIDINAASPTIVNNTIVRGDSNGIIIRGASAPVLMNNIIAVNGSVTATDRRGRGICDFSSGGTAVIHYNNFSRNRIGALLTNGRDFAFIRGAQRIIGAPRLVGNVDGRPGFVGRVGRSVGEAVLAHFALDGRGHATDAGNADLQFDDLDGTRNDIGFTGGPQAPTWQLD